MKKLLVFLLTLGLAAPAMAADWNFYGSVRTHLGYYHVSKEFTGGPAMDTTIRSNGIKSDSGVLLALDGQSRFGANVAASDNLAGRLEFGFHSGGTQPYLRLLYSTWNFGPGKLVVGQDYTPATFLGYSNMSGDVGAEGYSVMLTTGLPYISRQAQLKLLFGDFSLAFIKPNGVPVGPSNPDAFYSAGYTTANHYVPRIEAAYVFRLPSVNIRPIAAFQTYKVQDQATDQDKTITSYAVGLGASVTLGPAYIKATVSYQQNPGNYGMANTLTGVPALLSATLNTSGDVENAKLIAGTFVVGAKFNPTIGVEAGVGYNNAKLDNYVGTNEGKETSLVYYLQSPINLAKGVTIIPELGYMDRGKLKVDNTPDVDQGSMTYFDVNFVLNF